MQTLFLFIDLNDDLFPLYIDAVTITKVLLIVDKDRSDQNKDKQAYATTRHMRN